MEKTRFNLFRFGFIPNTYDMVLVFLSRVFLGAAPAKCIFVMVREKDGKEKSADPPPLFFLWILWFDAPTPLSNSRISLPRTLKISPSKYPSAIEGATTKSQSKPKRSVGNRGRK